jgi:hypothetical protein
VASRPWSVLDGGGLPAVPDEHLLLGRAWPRQLPAGWSASNLPWLPAKKRSMEAHPLPERERVCVWWSVGRDKARGDKMWWSTPNHEAPHGRGQDAAPLSIFPDNLFDSVFKSILVYSKKRFLLITN